MNNILQLIYYNVAAKIWCVSFFPVDCDIIFIIKTLLQYYSLRRTIKPPSISEFCNNFLENYIDDQGIVFTPYGGMLRRFPSEARVNTRIRYHDGNIISIEYTYYGMSEVYLCHRVVNFDLSDCNPMYIKVEQLSPFDHSSIYDYRPVLIYTC